MQAIAERYVTEAEYWEWEQSSPIKHEYFDGRLYAMSGGSNKHATLCLNAGATLRGLLRGKPCRAVGSEQRVKIEATGLESYPYVAVHCPPFRFMGSQNEVLLNPTVIVEVLAPSTAGFDRGKKYEHYKQIETLRDYLLVSQDSVHVDHYHRLENGDWLLQTSIRMGDILTLEAIGCTLPLRDVYEDIEVPTRPELLRDALTDEEVMRLF